MKWQQKIVSFLLVIVLLPFQQPLVTEATAASLRAMEDAMDLMVAARGILLEEDIEEAAATSSGALLLSIQYDVAPNSPADQILVRMINATKRELSDIERACGEVRGSFSEEGDECEEQLSKAYCEQRQSQLKSRLTFLRAVRGDRRKGLTKAWHSIKRAGARLWRAVGPIGRRFLRELGSDVLSIVKSGGSLYGGVLRSLIIKHARSVGQKSLERILQRGMQKMILGNARMVGPDCGSTLDPQADVAGVSDCSAEDWFEQAWVDIESRLLAERRNCQPSSIILVKDCIYWQAQSGACQDEAVAACQNLYDAIPPNLPASGATFTGETIYGRAVANEVSITLPGGPGPVSGRLYYQLYDSVGQCTITATTNVQGTYEPVTCTVSGSADHNITYDGIPCVSVCGPGPSSPAPCPVTITGSTTWKAELEDGVLIGAIGDESCDRHCFGFHAGP